MFNDYIDIEYCWNAIVYFFAEIDYCQEYPTYLPFDLRLPSQEGLRHNSGNARILHQLPLELDELDKMSVR